MAHTRTKRHFLSILDLDVAALEAVLDSSLRMKVEHASGVEHHLLAGCTLAMIFQKPSLRTRVSFETGMSQLGGHAIYLAPSDIDLGQRESTEDIGIVLGRYCDLIMARVFGHHHLEELAAGSRVPVINGLSDREHPCQILADLMTMQERKGDLAGLRVVYTGDGNNVAHSLMFSAGLLGLHLRIVTPPGYEPDAAILAESQSLATASGGSVEQSHDLAESAAGADVLYTDVWASMGQEEEAAERAEVFRHYQLNDELLAMADGECMVMHCLPAHYGEEISFEVSRSTHSAIFDQAENRLHAQKGLMVALAGHT